MIERRKLSDRYSSSKLRDVWCIWSGDWSVMRQVNVESSVGSLLVVHVLP